MATLRSLLHTGGITLDGLTKLLSTLRRTGLPEATSSHYVHEANNELFSTLRRVIEMPGSDGSVIEWELADPNHLLAAALEMSSALNQLYSDAMSRTPCSSAEPWNLVIGFDEFAPGFAIDDR